MILTRCNMDLAVLVRIAGDQLKAELERRGKELGTTPPQFLLAVWDGAGHEVQFITTANLTETYARVMGIATHIETSGVRRQ